MKALFKILVGLVVLYAVVNLILGSAPIQRRVLGEVKKALGRYGLDLEVESIEFSTLVPRIYLNRVVLRAHPVQAGLPAELPIDKLKVSFRPFSLLSRQIVFGEIMIYHPRIALADIEKTYEKLGSVIRSRFKVQPKGSKYALVVERVGIVDALIDVAHPSSGVTARSRSFSVIVENASAGQYNLVVTSPHLSLKRKSHQVELSKIDIDADIGTGSLRVNHAEVLGGELSISVQGSTALPITDVQSQTAQLTFDANVPLRLLAAVDSLATTSFHGKVRTQGAIQLAKGEASGKGQVQFAGVSVDGVGIGSGEFKFGLNADSFIATGLVAEYSSGRVTSDKVTLSLKDRWAVNGEVEGEGLRFESLLENLNATAKPVRGLFSVKSHVGGYLRGPFELSLKCVSRFSQVKVVADDTKPAQGSNTVLLVPEATVDTVLNFDGDRMAFEGGVQALGGTAKGSGYVSFNNEASLRVEGKDLSLTELGRIGTLGLGGRVSGATQIDYRGHEASLSADVSAVQMDIEGIVLGTVKGQLLYRGQKLSFEDLEIPALQPIRGSGFVDFRPATTAYKFTADVPRVSTDQVRALFEKKEWKKWFPTVGEMSGRFLLQGGGSQSGLEISTTGQARDIRWIEEGWRSAYFSVSFRDDHLELNRLSLLKRSGTIDVRGIIEAQHSQLTLQTAGLPVEELDRFRGVPISGNVIGEIGLENGSGVIPVRGSGDLRLENGKYRGHPMGNSFFQIAASDQGTRIDMSLADGRWKASISEEAESVGEPTGKRHRLSVQMAEFDFLPWVATALRRDLPNVGGVFLSGSLDLAGRLEDWTTISGKGVLQTARIDLTGSPMKNVEWIELFVKQGSVRLDRARFVGAESQLVVDLSLEPGKKVDGKIDANIDLQYLQPFLPGLEEGRGKVVAGLRLFGKPEAFEILGNLSLQDGALRITGVQDELRAVKAGLTLSQDRIQFDQFEGNLNGGTVTASGNIGIERFRAFSPNLKVTVNRGQLRVREDLKMGLSGTFSLEGTAAPYWVRGNCTLHEVVLSSLDLVPVSSSGETPFFRWDVNCQVPSGAFVRTEAIQAEFGGSLRVQGTDQQAGLTGTLSAKSGAILFRDNNFEITGGSVVFDDASRIYPRFNLSGRAIVKSAGGAGSAGASFSVQNQYEVTLQALGTPGETKIRLNSTPSLSEAEIISLLVMGSPSRSQQDSYVALGTALASQIPLQSKLKDALGLDIKVSAATSQAQAPTAGGTTPLVSDTKLIPNVQIEYGVSKRTRLYLSNNLGSFTDSPDPTANARELKIEHRLDDNVTINGTASDRGKSSTATQSTPSYGVDVRYRFYFE